MTTAIVLKDALLRAYDAYLLALKEDHKAALEKQEKDIDDYIAKNRKGWLWWKRQYTREEANDRLNEMWWQWPSATQAIKINGKISQIANIREALTSHNIKDVRLTEEEILELTDYLK